MYVFFPSWWAYVCARPFNFTKFLCRWCGHKDGPIFYNPGGYEPDMRCQNCGDYIG